MGEFSEALKKNHNLTDGDEKRIMALHCVFGGIESHPVDFIDAIEKLHKLGWHHNDETAR